MRTLGLCLCFALAGILACATSAAPTEFREAPRGIVTAPLHGNYRDWWALAEQCSQTRSDYATVRWYVVNGLSFQFPGRPPYLGAAYPRHRMIVLALGSVLDSTVVLHEMLHLIASPYYHRADVYQRGECAALVICAGNCLSDTLNPLP